MNSQAIQKETNDILRGIQTFMGALDLRMKYLEKCVEEEAKGDGTEEKMLKKIKGGKKSGPSI